MYKLVLLFLSVIQALSPSSLVQTANQGETTRRVNVPYFDGEISWAQTAIFWLGKVDPPGAPGKNYADVRVAYTAEELVIFLNVQDYYFWYDLDDEPPNGPTAYDSAAIYLDTAHDGAGSPQADDYMFISGLCLYGCDDRSRYRQQGRGNGTGWDMTWTSDWTEGTFASWTGNPPHNNNDNTFDYGWWTYIQLPWEALGQSGAPSSGALWGLGVILYDRDDLPPAGAVAPQTWPEDLDAQSPASWGEIHFGLPTSSPPAASVQGTTVIRRGLGQSVVQDSWVGGGGDCSGGHMGDPEHDNYGDSTSLFVENQELIADFPCFSKSFLRFHLDPIPPGKTIISATLSLHHWSNAEWSAAQPSLVWLLSVDGDWEENTLTWNNAPLAQQNLSTTWVDVITPDNHPGFPGNRYDWDATQAVAQAYAAGEPLNIAMYTADINFHSSKYLSSSEAGDWNAEARPMLTIAWGQESQLAKSARATRHSFGTLGAGDTITYTLEILGSGQALTVTDALPQGISHPLSHTSSDGHTSYDPALRKLTWMGAPTTSQAVTITYPVVVLQDATLTIINTALLTAANGATSTASHKIVINAELVFLPLIIKQK